MFINTISYKALSNQSKLINSGKLLRIY